MAFSLNRLCNKLDHMFDSALNTPLFSINENKCSAWSTLWQVSKQKSFISP